jgi:hypothetical protein
VGGSVSAEASRINWNHPRIWPGCAAIGRRFRLAMIPR